VQVVDGRQHAHPVRLDVLHAPVDVRLAVRVLVLETSAGVVTTYMHCQRVKKLIKKACRG
jgi:hypothetical protein